MEQLCLKLLQLLLKKQHLNIITIELVQCLLSKLGKKMFIAYKTYISENSRITCLVLTLPWDPSHWSGGAMERWNVRVYT